MLFGRSGTSSAGGPRRPTRCRAEVEDLRARAAEADELRPRAEEADTLRAEREELLRRAEDADELRNEQEGLRSEYQDLLDERDTLREEAQVLRARAAEADGLRDQLNEAAAKDIAPDVARLRAELENVERERNELRAQLDSTSQRLEESTQAMSPPTELDGEPPRRLDRPRRPAERTAKRAPEPEPGVSIADKVSDWVGSITGTRDEDQGSKNGERHCGHAHRGRPAHGGRPAHRGADRSAPQPRVALVVAPRRRAPAAGVPADHARRDPVQHPLEPVREVGTPVFEDA